MTPTAAAQRRAGYGKARVVNYGAVCGWQVVIGDVTPGHGEMVALVTSHLSEL